MRTQTIKASEVIDLDRDPSTRQRMPDGAGPAFIDDATLLSELATVRTALQQEANGNAELGMVHASLTAELDQRAALVWAKNYAPREEPMRVDCAPADMSTWELIATYRHAWALAYYRPRGYLAKALANWLLASQRELESRGAWAPEIMPPSNM